MKIDIRKWQHIMSGHVGMEQVPYSLYDQDEEGVVSMFVYPDEASLVVLRDDTSLKLPRGTYQARPVPGHTKLYEVSDVPVPD